jgi:hypothetical protein
MPEDLSGPKGYRTKRPPLAQDGALQLFDTKNSGGSRSVPQLRPLHALECTGTFRLV